MGLTSVNTDRAYPRLSPLEGRVPTGEFMSTVLVNTLDMLPFRNIYKATELAQASIPNEYNRVLSPQEANDKWGIPDDGIGDGGVKFEGYITEQKAFLIHNYKKEERKRNERIAKGSDSVGRGALALGVGLATQALDPINLGLMFIFPGIGQERTAAITLATGSKTVGRVAQAMSGVSAGMATTEPFSYFSKMFGEQNEYGPKDSLMNFVAGTVLGTGMTLGAGAIGDGLSRAAKRLEGLPPHITKKVLGDAARDLATGKPVDVEASIKSQVLDTLRQNSKRSHKKMEIDTAEGHGLEITPVTPEESVKLTPDQKLAKLAQEQADEAEQIKIKEQQAAGEQQQKKVETRTERNKNIDGRDKVFAPNGGHVYKYGETEIFVASFSNEQYRLGNTESLSGGLHITVLKTGNPEEYSAVLWHIFQRLDEQYQKLIEVHGKDPIKDSTFFEPVFINGRPYDVGEVHEFATGKAPTDNLLYENKPGSNLDVENPESFDYLQHGGRGAENSPERQLTAALTERNKDLIDAFRDPNRPMPVDEFGIDGVPKPKATDTPAPKPDESKPKATDTPVPKEEPSLVVEEEVGLLAFDERFSSLDDVLEVEQAREAEMSPWEYEYEGAPESDAMVHILEFNEEAFDKLQETLEGLGYLADDIEELTHGLDSRDFSKRMEVMNKLTDCIIQNRG
jgi:hypothetical protein